MMKLFTNKKNKLERSNNKGRIQAISSFLAIMMALLLSGLTISITGVNPFAAIKVLFSGAFGSPYAISETLLRTTPILIASIGLAISFRCNLTSVGAEGQMIIGAIAATLTGLKISLASPVLEIFVCIIAGFLGGALFGFIPGYLKAKLGTSEIIITIMLNYVAIDLLSYLLDGPMREEGSFYPQSALLDQSVWLPKILAGTRLHVGFIIAIIFVIIYFFLIFRTPLGFKIRAVGLNSKAAEYAGVNVGKSILTAMMLSGGLAGIAGAVEIFGVHHRLLNGFTSGVGFDALAVALLGKLNPFGVFIASLFFAALKVGSNTMQHVMQVPTSIVYVIQGLLILFVFTDTLIKDKLISFEKRIKKKQSGE
ncbi:MAG TPA: ABC transporter permease [Flexilinea sp.]|jgi:simple sugar transport system permease protein|nr:ABC transporter permease [Flexilinea sp.]